MNNHIKKEYIRATSGVKKLYQKFNRTHQMFEPVKQCRQTKA